MPLIFIAMGQGAILCAAVNHLLPIKKKWWAFFGLFILSWTLGGMIIYIGDLINLPPTLFGFLLAAWLCCEGSSLKKITMGLMIASTVFSWNSIVDNFIWSKNGMFLTPRIIFAILFFAGTKRFAPEDDYDLDPSMWKLMLLLTLLPMLSVCSVILLSDPDWVYDTNMNLHLAILCISLLSFVGLLGTVRVLVRQKQLEQESMFAQMNQKYYETMEQQHLEIRTLRHDLANHLQVLSLLGDHEKNSYIEELLHRDSFINTLNYCNDPTINAVLTVKNNVIQKEKIAFHILTDIPMELSIDKADLCAIYANALDNAVEACQKLPEEKREITLESRAGKGILVLNIKNSCESLCDITPGKSKMQNGKNMLPKTTKSDTKNHGFGLYSIEEIVKKYNGNLEIQREEESFTLFLYMQIPKEG